MLARKLNVPLDKITLNEIDPPASGATYRVHAFDAAGKEILTREFKVSTVMQPYNGVVPRYEDVQVETGWVHLEAAGKVALNERIKTDIEEFWDHYQNKTLPRVYQFVMSQAKGELRAEYLPPFDSLTLDIHMSEPDYSLDLDKERISTLEALQEDTFYSTDELHQHDRRSRNRPADRLHRPHHSDRAPLGRRQGRPRAHRVLWEARRQSAGAALVDRCHGRASHAGAQSAAADRRISAAPDPGARQSRRRRSRAADLASARRFRQRQIRRLAEGGRPGSGGSQHLLRRARARHAALARRNAPRRHLSRRSGVSAPEADGDRIRAAARVERRSSTRRRRASSRVGTSRRPPRRAR